MNKLKLKYPSLAFDGMDFIFAYSPNEEIRVSLSDAQNKTGAFKSLDTDEQWVLFQRLQSLPKQRTVDNITKKGMLFHPNSRGNQEAYAPLLYTGNALHNVLVMLKGTGAVAFDKEAWDIILTTHPTLMAKSMSSNWNWNMELYEDKLIDWMGVNCNICILKSRADTGDEPLPKGVKQHEEWHRLVTIRGAASWPFRDYSTQAESLWDCFGKGGYKTLHGGGDHWRAADHVPASFAFVTKEFFEEHDMLTIQEDARMHGKFRPKVSCDDGFTTCLMYTAVMGGDGENKGPLEPMLDPPSFSINGNWRTVRSTGNYFGCKKFNPFSCRKGFIQSYWGLLEMDAQGDRIHPEGKYTQADRDRAITSSYDDYVVCLYYPDGKAVTLDHDDDIEIVDGLAISVGINEDLKEAA